MGLFTRKEDRPRIPPSPTLPELPRREYRGSPTTGLPSIPSGNTNENINQEMIKSAMDEDQLDVDENQEYQVTMPQSARRDVQRPPYHSPLPRPPVEGQPRRETIFVKIDQFNNAQDSLSEIENKIKELSSDIQALKEIKIKEVEELNAWDEELKKINTRLSKIDSTIFGEV